MEESHIRPAAQAEAPQPRVTALVLTRNSATELQRCLEALEQSTSRETLEILVVDNGSTDGTREITAAFPNVSTLRLPKNFGATRAWNIGIRTAKGESVLLIRPQFQVQPDTISRLAERLETSADIGAVCPYTPRWYRLPSPSRLKEVLETGQLAEGESTTRDAESVAVDYPRGAPMLVRRSFLVSMNYFDERFGEHWWDLELCWQIRKAGKRILVLPDVQVVGPEPTEKVFGAIDAADLALGAAAFAGKHYGTGAGLRIRLGAMLHSLGRLVTFRDPGFHSKRLSAILSGQKIDGTQ